mmetsp:Transcript_7157/g.16375  ORF Transcript_7157/g.16375 Transcript_7157/m.16375 type:complete len:386 (-) Transcript_7157:61-1218(-)
MPLRSISRFQAVLRRLARRRRRPALSVALAVLTLAPPPCLLGVVLPVALLAVVARGAGHAGRRVHGAREGRVLPERAGPRTARLPGRGGELPRGAVEAVEEGLAAQGVPVAARGALRARGPVAAQLVRVPEAAPRAALAVARPLVPKAPGGAQVPEGLEPPCLPHGRPSLAARHLQPGLGRAEETWRAWPLRERPRALPPGGDADQSESAVGFKVGALDPLPRPQPFQLVGERSVCAAVQHRLLGANGGVDRPASQRVAIVEVEAADPHPLFDLVPRRDPPDVVGPEGDLRCGHGVALDVDGPPVEHVRHPIPVLVHGKVQPQGLRAQVAQGQAREPHSAELRHGVVIPRPEVGGHGLHGPRLVAAVRVRPSADPLAPRLIGRPA